MNTQCPRILFFFSRVIMSSVFFSLTVSKLNSTVKLNNDKFFTAQQSDFIEKMLIDIVIRLKVNRKTHVQLSVNYWQVD